MTDFCYSRDDETFFPDFGEMLETGDEMQVGDVYYVAESIDVTASDFERSDSLIEDFADDFHQMMGEDMDNPFDDISEVAKEELKTLLEDWINKNVPLSRYFLIKQNTSEPKIILHGDV